jgi:hypothetical protein
MFHFTFKYVTPCSEVLFAIGQPYGFTLCKNCISGLKNMNIIYKLLVASILKRYRTFTCTTTNFLIFFYFLFSTLYIHISNKHKKYLDNKFLISKMVSLFFIYLFVFWFVSCDTWMNKPWEVKVTVQLPKLSHRILHNRDLPTKIIKPQMFVRHEHKGRNRPFTLFI